MYHRELRLDVNLRQLRVDSKGGSWYISIMDAKVAVQFGKLIREGTINGIEFCPILSDL